MNSSQPGGSRTTDDTRPLIPLDAIHAARHRLEPYLRRTPLRSSAYYSRLTGTEVVYKLELFLPTGAFKVRGALNALLSLAEADRRGGVVTASAGNHGLGIAFAAHALGMRATIVLPESTPAIRIDAMRDLGADVIVTGRDWNAAHAHALTLEARDGLRYVSPFDDADIIAGQGTVALELLEERPDVTTIVASVGGGGLISGIASAVRALRPDVRVIGVETRGADCMAQSLAAGRIVTLPEFTSIAQSLGTKATTDRPFGIVRQAVERVVVVDDVDALRDLLRILSFDKLLVEPAASCAVSALRLGLVPDLAGVVAPILCGGNITLEHVHDWMRRFDVNALGDA